MLGLPRVEEKLELSSSKPPLSLLEIICAGQGIRLAPSAPPMKTLSARGIPDFHAMQARAIDGSCLQKPLSPDEIASYATFLASSQASGITGQVVSVDGGYNCML